MTVSTTTMFFKMTPFLVLFAKCRYADSYTMLVIIMMIIPSDVLHSVSNSYVEYRAESMISRCVKFNSTPMPNEFRLNASMLSASMLSDSMLIVNKLNASMLIVSMLIVSVLIFSMLIVNLLILICGVSV
jgi:hypothetical protein